MIKNKEYISIEIEHGNGIAELEAFPCEGALGPVFFRWHGQRGIYGSTTAAVKTVAETWNEFFARQDPDWVLTPLMRELAETLNQNWTHA